MSDTQGHAGSGAEVWRCICSPADPCVPESEVSRLRAELGQPEIAWTYHGESGGYHVFMGSRQIYFTKDARDRDLFIAQVLATHSASPAERAKGEG